MDPVALVGPVGELLRAAADVAIRPRFRRLAAADVAERAAGELVTIADQQAEELIIAGLRAPTPGVPVIAEEASAADPSLDASVSDTAPWDHAPGAPPRRGAGALTAPQRRVIA